MDSGGNVDCDMCGWQSHLEKLEEEGRFPPTVTTYSLDRPIPLWAKSDQEQKFLRENSKTVRATIEEPCIKCGHGEVGYYTAQLRSVDEGQTVFYECPKCGHHWSQNN